jgi:hypothetical protein
VIITIAVCVVSVPVLAQSTRAIAAVHTTLVAEAVTELERQNGLLEQTWARVATGAEAIVTAQRQGESLESLRNRVDEQQQLESELLMRIFEVQRARREVLTNLAVIEAAGGTASADRVREGPLTGTWRLNVQPGLTGTAYLVQTGTLVSGTYELSGGWNGSFRGTFVADKVRLERIDSKLGFAAIFYGGLDRGPDGLVIQGRWEATQLATGMPSAGGWNATLED